MAEGEAWSQERHLRYPAAFQQAVGALLLCAGRSPTERPGVPAEATLHALPTTVLHRIIGHLAEPVSTWL